MKKNQQRTNERRQETRRPTHLESILEQKTSELYTTVVNLSKKGVGFLSARPFKKNEVVNMNLSLQNQNTNPIKLTVHVQSCHKIDLEYYIGGLVIRRIDNNHGATIPYA
ncbi:MAG: PilZ domain-containing protein [Thiomicrorhabdus sp.]|nr:PilZ domain-containing protein [Thiomicrorhabdus sp.]